jgi:hypothetical protein
MSFVHSKNIITPLRKRYGLDDVFFIIEKIWLREIYIDGANFVGYKDGVVFIATQSTAVCCELRIRKKEIIKTLNQYIGDSRIKDIKTRII